MMPSFEGTYILVSFSASSDGGAWTELFGASPRGRAVITSTRFTAVLTARDRASGSTPLDHAALWASMCAYSGTYRIDGPKFITSVDVSWNESWNGTDQARTWHLEGPRLTLVTDPGPNPFDPSRSVVFRVVWDRLDNKESPP